MWPIGVATSLYQIPRQCTTESLLYKTLLKHYIHQLLFDNSTKNNHRPAITLLVSTYFEEHHIINHFHKTIKCTRTLKKKLWIFRKHKNIRPPFDQIRSIGVSATWIYKLQSCLVNHNTRTTPINNIRHQQTSSISERHYTQPRKTNNPFSSNYHHRLTHHDCVCQQQSGSATNPCLAPTQQHRWIPKKFGSLRLAFPVNAYTMEWNETKSQIGYRPCFTARCAYTIMQTVAHRGESI